MRRPITQAMRQTIARREGGRPGVSHGITCTYCNTAIYVDWRDPKRVRFVDEQGRSTPELDHIACVVDGGHHVVENLVPACLRCNRSKGAKVCADAELELARARVNA